MTEEPEDYEGPWPSEDAMTKPTVDEVMGLVKDYACRSFIPGSGMKEAHDKLRAALESLIAAPAAPQQAEPVGYFVNDESDDQWHQVDYEQRNGADTYPLYLHPPAVEAQRLRDALKPFAAIDLTTNQAVDPMDVLRARRALRRE